MLVRGDGKGLWTTFGQYFMFKEQGREEEAEKAKVICSLDIVAYVFIQEELEHLKGSQQLKLLESQHPELLKWHNRFEAVIDEFSGSLPYANIDR